MRVWLAKTNDHRKITYLQRCCVYLFSTVSYYMGLNIQQNNKNNHLYLQGLILSTNYSWNRPNKSSQVCLLFVRKICFCTVKMPND